MAVKFQMCGINRGNARVSAAQIIRIVKTKNLGDLICSVMHQNYDFFLDAVPGNKNLLKGLQYAVIWRFFRSEYYFAVYYK